MVVVIITTIVLAALPIISGILLWTSRKSWRGLIQGIGLGVIIIALAFLGMIDLFVNGIASLFAWAQRTVWNARMTNASITAGVGILMVIIGHFLSTGSSRKSSQTGNKPKPVTNSTPTTVGIAPTAKDPHPEAVLPPKGAKHSPNPEDAEIEALLKRRGIQ